MQDLSVCEFASRLSAKEPVPGGGGAAALCGALAAALGSMVISYTVGKKKYAEYEPELLALLEECGSLKDKLLKLIDEDAAAFEPLSRAYGIPKDDPNREERLEAALKDAASAPIEMLRLSCRVIEIAAELEKKGSALMQSDVGCAAVMAWSAMYAAALNVRVNTRLMKDREYAKRLDTEVKTLMDMHWKTADETYEAVWRKLS